MRDTYDLGDNALLLIATDRISAFDCVLPCGIPDKGMVLNQLSAFWFDKTKHIIPNHLNRLSRYTVDSLKKYLPMESNAPTYLLGRSMIVKKAERVPVEAVVRGYISGSAWAEYEKSGTISGIPQPNGIKESQELTQPMFTPTTKADSGHDMPLNKKELEDLVGKDTSTDSRRKKYCSLRICTQLCSSEVLLLQTPNLNLDLLMGNSL